MRRPSAHDAWAALALVLILAGSAPAQTPPPAPPPAQPAQPAKSPSPQQTPSPPAPHSGSEGGLGGAPAPLPAKPGAEADRAAQAYVDGQENGALIPQAASLPDCLTPAQTLEIKSLYYAWQTAYKAAVDAARDYVRAGILVQVDEANLERDRGLEINANAELGFADARERPAAQAAWNKAKDAVSADQRILAHDKERLDGPAREASGAISVLRAKRDAYRAAIGKLPKDACPPPLKTSGVIPPRTTGVAAQSVLDELNFARTRPAEYAATVPADTIAGQEAIAFLRAQAPVAALSASPLLDGAASAHVSDQAKSAAPGHTGADGSTPMQRMQRAGVWSTIYAEEIALGADSAQAIVRQLIIDRGVAGHPHRTDLFSPNLKFAGVACGPSTAASSICVIDLAAAPPAR